MARRQHTPAPKGCSACDTAALRAALTDMKMHLTSTDYGNFLQNEPTPISSSTLQEKCTVIAVPTSSRLCARARDPSAVPSWHFAPKSARDAAQEKLVEEFTFLRNQAVEPMATFFDYITCASSRAPLPRLPGGWGSERRWQ